jgi:hypothetical protein
MAFTGKHPSRSKIVIYDTPIGQVNHFNYLGCTISVSENKDLETKLRKFNHICGTIRRVLNEKTQITFYKVTAIPALTYSSEIWTLTKSKGKRRKQQKLNFFEMWQDTH